MEYAQEYTPEDSFTTSSIFTIIGTLIRMNLGNTNESGKYNYNQPNVFGTTTKHVWFIIVIGLAHNASISR